MANRPATLITAEQLPLSPGIHSVHRGNGDRIRALLRRAIQDNGISQSTLEHETGIDEKQIGRSLRDDGGAHPPLTLIAAVFHLDRLGILIGGLALMCGREAIVRKPDPEAENKHLRSQILAMRDELDRLLGGER